MVLLWEHEAGIDQDVSIIHPNQHAVHANFAKTAHWQNSEWRSLARRGAWEWSVGLPLQSRTQMLFTITLYEKPTSLALARLHDPSVICKYMQLAQCQRRPPSLRLAIIESSNWTTSRCDKAGVKLALSRSCTDLQSVMT